MPTSTISNTILDPNGVAIANVPVTVRLMPSGGFRVDTLTEVARVAETTTNASGFWSLALERNSNITPGTTSTWYEVTETIPNADGGTRTWTIQVGASDQTVLASLVTPAQPQPTVVPPGVTYISQASGDARYQAVGSLGSGTPATETPDHAGTAGVATSASRSDHIHPITADVPVAIGTALSEGAAATFARSDHVHTGPLGTVPNGYQALTSNQTGITTTVDVTGLAVTFTAVAGRRYRVLGHLGVGSTVTTDVIRMALKEGAATLQIRDVVPGVVSGTSGNVSLDAFAVVVPTAGAHTYKVTLERLAGTGTLLVAGNAGFPSFIHVEDVGT